VHRVAGGIDKDMNFDNHDFDAFRRDLKNATRELCEKYQINLKQMGSISYGPVDFTLKLTFEKNEYGVNSERIKFETECFYYGFEPSDYMRSFRHIDSEYEFIGFERSAKKYNCRIRDLETGIVSRVNNVFLKQILDRDAKVMAAERGIEESNGYMEDDIDLPNQDTAKIDNLNLLTKEDLSLLNIKLGKSKRGMKDWDQIREIFHGRDFFTYCINISNPVAVEDNYIVAFTSKEEIDNHLALIGQMGILQSNAYVISYGYDELIDLAEQMKKDVIFDLQYETNRGYYVYGVENHKLKVVILAGR